jgi:hypothetical protein
MVRIRRPDPRLTTNWPRLRWRRRRIVRLSRLSRLSRLRLRLGASPPPIPVKLNRLSRPVKLNRLRLRLARVSGLPL